MTATKDLPPSLFADKPDDQEPSSYAYELGRSSMKIEMLVVFRDAMSSMARNMIINDEALAEKTVADIHTELDAAIAQAESVNRKVLP